MDSDLEKVEFCTECQVRMNKFWTYCPNCGTKIAFKDGVDFYD